MVKGKVREEYGAKEEKADQKNGKGGTYKGVRETGQRRSYKE